MVHSIRKDFFPVRVTEHRTRLSTETVESAPLEMFQTHLDAFLSNVLLGTLAGGGTRPSPEDPLNLYGSVMVSTKCRKMLCHGIISVLLCFDI